MALVLGTNSYATVAEADTYYDDNLRNDSWDGLGASVQSQALITASGNISNAVLEECRLPIDLPIDDSLKQATYELALDMGLDSALVTNPGTTNADGNIKKVVAGPASVEYFRVRSGQALSDRIYQILAVGGCAFVPGPSIGTSSASGTGDSSSFDCPSNRTKGFF